MIIHEVSVALTPAGVMAPAGVRKTPKLVHFSIRLGYVKFNNVGSPRRGQSPPQWLGPLAGVRNTPERVTYILSQIK